MCGREKGWSGLPRAKTMRPGRRAERMIEGEGGQSRHADLRRVCKVAVSERELRDKVVMQT